MVETVTSYSDAAGTSVENEIANVYNGFGQVVEQAQQHDGAVNSSTSPKVGYADGSANTIRATSMTYPDGAVLDYRYDDDAADALSRVRTLRFDSVDVCRYDYLGLGTFVRADYVEPDADSPPLPNECTASPAVAKTGRAVVAVLVLFPLLSAGSFAYLSSDAWNQWGVMDSLDRRTHSALEPFCKPLILLCDQFIRIVSDRS